MIGSEALNSAGSFGFMPVDGADVESDWSMTGDPNFDPNLRAYWSVGLGGFGSSVVDEGLFGLSITGDAGSFSVREDAFDLAVDGGAFGSSDTMDAGDLPVDGEAFALSMSGAVLDPSAVERSFNLYVTEDV